MNHLRVERRWWARPSGGALLVVVSVLLAGCGSGRAAGAGSASGHPASSPARLRRIHFHSRALGREDSYLVWLPPGYAAKARRGVRFSVLYLLHGDGVGSKHTALHMYEAARIDAQASSLLAKGRIEPFLIVMPEGDNGTSLGDTEWANTPSGAYGSYLLDVVHAVQHRWRVIDAAAARAIAGLSMGGYGAVNFDFHRPEVFRTIESWSGYFSQTTSGPYTDATPAQKVFASPSRWFPHAVAGLRANHPTFLLYSGAGDKLTAQQAPFARQLASIGLKVRTAIFPGFHSYRLWASHLPLALSFAGHHMAAPQPGR